jgi:adenosylcobinamide kinase/adenosylcobinamide-phosphate guanylyltransferase
MAELVTGPGGAVVDGILHLGRTATPPTGYHVTAVPTPAGIRYDVTTPTGDRLSWTDSGVSQSAQRTLVLGGARSGKSTEAERLLADRGDVLYVATGGDADGDAAWAERIAVHRARRPATWGLTETIDLVPLLASGGPALLIDCLTLWLTRTMDECEVWTGPERVTDVEDRMTELADAWSVTPREIVAVSNDVGSGVVPATASGVVFRDLMGRLNTMIARASDEVLWCLAGRVVPL